MKRPAAVSTDQAPKAIGPYSQGVSAGEFVSVSGQIPLDPSTGTVAGPGVREQTERVLKNVAGILAAAGLGLEHVVKTTVYLKDMGTFAEMNEVYARHFGGGGAPFPARATVEVSALPKAALVEIDAVAVRIS